MRKKAVPFKTVLVVICAMMAFLAGLSGCGGSGGDSKGTLKLSITDAQRDDFNELVVAIREIRVVPSGRENATDDDPALPVLATFSTPRVIDIMQLQFIQQSLGEVVLPAGRYSQIRLILESNPSGNQSPVNYLTLKSDPATKVPLTTPSGQQSGLKVLGPIDVEPGVINAVMIDFDPNTAVVARGNGGYNFKPTGIRLVELSAELQQFGSIIGNVTSGFRSWSSATVAIKRRGTINDTDPIAAGRIFSNFTSGTWQAPFSAFLPASSAGISYKAFVTANGFRLYSSQTVPVIQGQATDLGQLALTPQ